MYALNICDGGAPRAANEKRRAANSTKGADGRLTPPGSSSSARAKSFAEVVIAEVVDSSQ
jgi:hypothetical protein